MVFRQQQPFIVIFFFHEKMVWIWLLGDFLHQNGKTQFHIRDYQAFSEKQCSEKLLSLRYGLWVGSFLLYKLCVHQHFFFLLFIIIIFNLFFLPPLAFLQVLLQLLGNGFVRAVVFLLKTYRMWSKELSVSGEVR